MRSTSIRPVALGDQLAALLRGMIVRGEIPPGTHLVEDALAAEHDVSRGPVRDAFRTLVVEGLLESRRRGYFTKPFSQADIDELYEIRTAAEQLACRLALERASAASWERAGVCLEEMRRHAETGDQRSYALVDLAFHTEFYVQSGNARLLALWRQYQPTFATLLEITNAQDEDLQPSLQDHDRLIELALAADHGTFSEHLTEHLAGSHRRLSTAVSGVALIADRRA